jgi:hypothetical protein
MDKKNDEQGPGRDGEAWWARVAADLAAYGPSRRAWGGVDENALARYEAGTCGEEEREKVEQALRDFPELRESEDLVRKILAEDAEPLTEPDSILHTDPEHSLRLNRISRILLDPQPDAENRIGVAQPLAPRRRVLILAATGLAASLLFFVVSVGNTMRTSESGLFGRKGWIDFPLAVNAQAPNAAGNAPPGAGPQAEIDILASLLRKSKTRSPQS